MHYPRTHAAIQIVLIAALLLTAAFLPTSSLSLASKEEDPADSAQAQPMRILLPLVQVADTFSSTPALWPHSLRPQEHEVALFRCAISLDMPLSDSVLQIFADTRYEAWLNGSFIGRGPARFSQVRREYDQLALGSLPAGTHTLAVLAQWAPNFRRSESISPQLQARIIGNAGASRRMIALHAGTCQAIESNAWSKHPTQVHTWEILGPAELLDLERLPARWNQPSFDATSWPRAAVRSPTAIAAIYQPRSIAALAEVPITPRLFAVGRLSPGAWVGELVAGADGSAAYTFSLADETSVMIQALAAPGQPALASAAALDGAALAWAPLPAAHPDTYQASVQLSAGLHQLAVSGLAAGESWVFCIDSQRITSAPPGLGAGDHAGRRLLVPSLEPDAAAVTLGAGPGFDLTFGPGPAYAILDLGRTTYGRLEADVVGPAGTLVDIGWDERLWHGTRPLPYPGSLHPEWDQSDSWVLAGDAHALTTIDARAGRYILIAVWASAATTLHNLRITEERYPLAQIGSFNSGDARLDTIWQVGVDTLRSNMTDGYADPWRERGQWWGDAHIADHANQVAFGDTDLLRRGLMQIGDTATGGRPTALAPNGQGIYLIDYGMYWVQSAYDYGRRSGDWSFVETIYPQIQAFMRYLASLESPQSGLIDMGLAAPASICVDSSSYWDRLGQTTAANAFYYRTLLDSAKIATQLGRIDQAAAWSTRAATLRSQANQALYIPAEARYSGGILNGQRTDATAQAQAAALAFGLVPDGDDQRVANTLLTMLGSPDQPNVQILGMYLVLSGLGRVGRVDDGVAVIERFFGSMIDRGATTWWENFNADQRYSSSLSHAWGSSPTWFLSAYLLGARQTGPNSWEVSVPVTVRQGASGQLPMANRSSALSVVWSASTCGQVSLAVNGPANMTGIIALPSPGSDAEIWIDGVQEWANGQARNETAISLMNNVFRISLDAGGHQIDTRHRCQ
jgi:alpha-L-rhamnosidase